MSTATYDSFLDDVSAEKSKVASLLGTLSDMPEVFASTLKVSVKSYALLRVVDSFVSEVEREDGKYKQELQDVEFLKKLGSHLEWLVSSLKEMISLQMEHKAFRYFIGWESELIDRMEDLIEDLDISTDPEIRSLMHEAGQKLSPADVI